MKSLILSAATRLLVALMLLFSVYMLLRGHNDPGGGFIGGLIAGIGFALYAMAHGTEAARRALRLDPGVSAMLGLRIALLAGLWSALVGDALYLRDVALLELLGNVCMLFILLHSCAAIFYTMGRFLHIHSSIQKRCCCYED